MRIIKSYIAIILLASFVIIEFITGCKKETDIPIVVTYEATMITDSTARCGGIVKSDGGEHVTERGVLFSQDPSLFLGWSSQTFDGEGKGEFISTIEYLNPGTEYYIQAYATNKNGTAFGEKLSFTTLQK